MRRGVNLIYFGQVQGKLGSNEAQRLEARMAFTANDNMVVNGDAEGCGACDDLLRHVDVGTRRRRVARRVVVHENDCRCRQLQRALHHLAHVDRGMVDGAVALHLVGDEAVALVEKQDAELLTVLVALRGA